MDEKLLTTLRKIRALAVQNKEFAHEMRKMFGNTSSTSVVFMPDSVPSDVKAIREALEIRAKASITYDFIKHQRLKDQLIIDNLRMENAALDLTHKEEERFYTFCVNAFYQVENIINYYFFITYPDLEDEIQLIEDYTSTESKGNFQFKRSGKEKSISDIPIAHKINAICNILMPNDKIKWILGLLRQVRNEGEHRCMVILQQKDDSSYLYHFLKENTFNNVRISLIKIVRAVQDNIGKPVKPSIEIKEAIITSILPSACFVMFEGNTVSLPNKLINKIKGQQVGDKISISISNGQVEDVKI